MRIAIFTQDERVYLPRSIEIVVEALADDVACIVVSPAMSTHGGPIKGLLRHLPVFGVSGTIRMGWNVLLSRIGPALGLRPPWQGPWSIREIAERRGIPFHSIDDVNSDAMHDVLAVHPADLLVSISCPQVIRSATLSKFPLGGINAHSSPLPRYRGLMPAFWVLLHREPKTAVTVHDLGQKLDDGDIILQRPVEIRRGETWNSLVRRTKDEAGSAVVDAVEAMAAGTASRRPTVAADGSYFSFPTWKDAREFRRLGLRMF